MAIKKSQESVIEEFQKKHGSTYNYNKVKYSNGSAKVCIICKIHGEFWQQPRAHAAGQGCSRCTQRPSWTPGKKDLKHFILKANTIHNNKYDYSKTEYTGVAYDVTISCPEHGDFTIRANGHLNGRGCPTCTNNQRKSTTQFILEAHKIHGDKYNYNKTIYISAHTKVVITCPDHGDYAQTPSSHISLKHGCPGCGLMRCAISNISTIENFIESAIKIHGYTYDYSKSIYELATKPIEIICKQHGSFWQRPRDHINGKNGCPNCAGNQPLTTEEFITKATERWDNRYLYDKSIYINSKSKLIVVCKKHGDFEITARYHLADGGCPQCSLSTEQHDLTEFIKTIYGGEIKTNDRKTISPLELDIYIPEIKLAIELNGTYFHSYNQSESVAQRERHRHKHSLCSVSDISLLQFTDYEWNKKRSLVKSMIEHKFGLSTKIGARKCELTIDVPHDFFRTNHIHGFKSAFITAGLKHNDEIVCAMSWTKHSKHEWEICRLASKMGICVVGGANKLLTWFIKTFTPKSLFTYADKRFSRGNVYRALGFTEIGSTKPNYQYVDKVMRPYSRIKFQKHKLLNILEKFDPNKSESENMFINGYRRLWDAGHYKFLLNVGH